MLLFRCCSKDTGKFSCAQVQGSNPEAEWRGRAVVPIARGAEMGDWKN